MKVVVGNQSKNKLRAVVVGDKVYFYSTDGDVLVLADALISSTPLRRLESVLDSVSSPVGVYDGDSITITL